MFIFLSLCFTKHGQFQIFWIYRNFALKLDFNNCKIIVLTQIVIENLITSLEHRALLVRNELRSQNFFISHHSICCWNFVSKMLINVTHISILPFAWNFDLHYTIRNNSTLRLISKKVMVVDKLLNYCMKFKLQIFHLRQEFKKRSDRNWRSFDNKHNRHQGLFTFVQLYFF